MKKYFFIALLLSPLFWPSDMIQVLGAEEVREQVIYSCPMHPEVKSTSPGKCPICSMTLQKIEKKAPNGGGSRQESRKIKFYRNPMKPEMTSKVPTKDEMGMDYVPVYEEETGLESLSNVARRGVVSLDVTRFRLSGAALTKVQKQDLVSNIPVSGRALSPSRISVQVPESDVSALKPGLDVQATSPSALDEILFGKVVSLDSSLDPMTRTLRVDVQLSKPYQGLRGESSIQGVIKKTISGALSIPEGAVMRGEAGSYVFLASEKAGLLIPRLISPGIKADGKVEILKGLAEGDMISAGPNFLLDSESRIQASHGE